jgi:hypothetical protein
MAGNFSLGTRFGVNNIMVPKGGPATIPALLDFTNASEVEIDGEIVISNGKIEYLQGVYIDNADNADALKLTMNTTGQRIVCPPNSQGYFAIMAPNPPKILATTPQGASKKISVFFYNVPIQSFVWGTT